MATARELLEQAEALMRRNRLHEPDPDIPELTEVVGTDDRDLDDDSIADFGSVNGPPIVVPERSAEAPMGRDTSGDADTFPVLTEVVAGLLPPATKPDSVDDREREAARWDRLAQDVRMQVLQRIDIFTDTGLQEQLKEWLQPIVDRASADLVATINREVGQLLRTYVAEAIEREIDKWRQGGG